VLDPNHPEEAVEPTAKQLAFLRALAQCTGETFASPRTRAEASSEIRRLPAGRAAAQSDPGSTGPLARRLHVEDRILERVIDVDEEGVHLVAQRRWLDRAKRPAMRQVADFQA